GAAGNPSATCERKRTAPSHRRGLPWARKRDTWGPMHLSRDEEAASVLRSLRQLVHALRATSHAVEDDVGLTGAQLFVLRELAAEPGASIRRLSERTMTDPSSVSAVVARLTERGLVDR